MCVARFPLPPFFPASAVERWIPAIDLSHSFVVFFKTSAVVRRGGGTGLFLPVILSGELGRWGKYFVRKDEEKKRIGKTFCQVLADLTRKTPDGHEGEAEI